MPFAKKNPAFVESDKYSWISEINQVELNALFRLMDFRVLLGMNLHNVNHLFEDHEGQLVFRQ